jgi:triphosphatase
VLFGGIVPRKATAPLRALLNDAEAVLLAGTADGAVQHRRQSAKLALTEWLVNRGWRRSSMRRRRKSPAL